jgi:hypothetical protein
MELSIYSLLGLAAVVMFLAPLTQVRASGLSLKDPPGYHIQSAPRPSHWVIEMPQPKPEGERNDSGYRAELSVCVSYFIIARTIYTNIDPDLAENYKQRAKAIFRELEVLPLSRAVDEDNIFITIYEEFVWDLENLPEGAPQKDRGAGLYDRYEATCSAVVRPLLQKYGLTAR